MTDNHSTLPLAFVDTETTGLHQDKQLWEVAIIRREFDPVDSSTVVPLYKESRYEAFVPVDLSNADLFGLNVGKFYERHPMGRSLSGREPSGTVPANAYRIADGVARFTHGARFIGAAPSFDAEVLGKFLRKHALLPTWHHRLVDTHELALGVLIGRGRIDLTDPFSIKKDYLAQLLGVKQHTGDAVHTAMGDAQHEADIWDAVMGD